MTAVAASVVVGVDVPLKVEAVIAGVLVILADMDCEADDVPDVAVVVVVVVTLEDDGDDGCVVVEPHIPQYLEQ